MHSKTRRLTRTCQTPQATAHEFGATANGFGPTLKNAPVHMEDSAEKHGKARAGARMKPGLVSSFLAFAKDQTSLLLLLIIHVDTTWCPRVWQGKRAGRQGEEAEESFLIKDLKRHRVGCLLYRVGCLVDPLPSRRNRERARHLDLHREST